MKVWIARDEILGYTLWKREPYLVKNIGNCRLFMNDDLNGATCFKMLDKRDLEIDKFPTLNLNEHRELIISRDIYNYYFLLA